jgi:cell pole-organizing protein PopZ
MSAQAKPNEPSMEEILASIRRIIADDEVKPADEPQPAPAPAVADAPNGPEIDEDVLDLGAEAALVSVPEPKPEPAPEQPPIGDVDFLEIPEAAQPEPSQPPPEPAPGPTQASAPVPERPPQQPAIAPPQFDMAQLLSDQTSSAVTSAFGQLAHTVLSNNARTLEDLVKDMLKPMLKTWLDDNLPTMVERLVRAEIERVARGGRS